MGHELNFFLLSKFLSSFSLTEQVHLALLGIQDGQADSDQQVKKPQIFT